MKHIIKHNEPDIFTEWKSLANKDWQPTYGDLSGEKKRAVKSSLMDEQGYICCYCERRLTATDSHIEHFRPQSDPAIDPLDYDNMLCSCLKRTAKGEPRHCGKLKENWYDADLLVSPLREDCEDRFAYLFNGEIKPKNEDDTAAVETIKRLGLDIGKLTQMRARAIEPFIEMFQDEKLTEQELQTFVTGYLQKDSKGKLGQFWTTVRYLFGKGASAKSSA